MNWNNIQDSEIKFRLMAFETQLKAIQEKGPEYGDLHLVTKQMLEIRDEAMKWMGVLAKAALHAEAVAFAEAVSYLFELSSQVVDAISINFQRQKRTCLSSA